MKILKKLHIFATLARLNALLGETQVTEFCWKRLDSFNWEDNLGIFIHSYADFETVYQHLRKFPMLQDERGKWFFFRFYDPKVLHDYLAIIAKRPAKLN